jgi:hypothetical protein
MRSPLTDLAPALNPPPHDAHTDASRAESLRCRNMFAHSRVRSLVTILSTDQWTGHSNADATGTQLQTLQGMVLRLMRGEVAKVESNWKQQLFLKDNDSVTAKRWKAALPHMFICKDFSCLCSDHPPR